MISLCIAADTQDDKKNTRNCQKTCERPSQAQCPGHRKQDFQMAVVDLWPKLTSGGNTSSCHIDPAKPQIGIRPPEPDGQVPKDVHCSMIATGEMSKNWKIQWQEMSRKSASTSRMGKWDSLPTDIPPWGKPCGLSTTCTTVPGKGWLKVHCFSPRFGYNNPKFGRGGREFWLPSLKANGEALTWRLFKRSGHVVWQVFIYFSLQSKRIFLFTSVPQYLGQHTEINSKWITDFNVKANMVNLQLSILGICSPWT